MCPVHRTPLFCVIELIEEVIFALVIYKTVRIISPAVFERVVIFTAVRLIVVDSVRLSAVYIDAVCQSSLCVIVIFDGAEDCDIVDTYFDRDALAFSIFIAVRADYSHFRSAAHGSSYDVNCGSIILHILNVYRLFLEELALLFNSSGRLYCDVLKKRVEVTVDRCEQGILEHHLTVPVEKSEITVCKACVLASVIRLNCVVTGACDEHIIDIKGDPSVISDDLQCVCVVT